MLRMLHRPYSRLQPMSHLDCKIFVARVACVLGVEHRIQCWMLTQPSMCLHKVLSRQVGGTGYKHVAGHTTILADGNGGRASRVQS